MLALGVEQTMNLLTMCIHVFFLFSFGVLFI